jgi:hypothetical protein
MLGKRKPATSPQDAHLEIQRLRRELTEAQAENGALRDQLEGKKDSIWWVQRKVWQQRKALDALHTRVVSQRFQLRTLNQMGRGLTPGEYRAARDAEANVQLRERVEEEPAVV